MSLSRFSRRARISEAKSERKLVFSLALGVVVFVALIFFGIPALINMSTFISNLRHGNEQNISQTQDKTIVFPPVLQPVPEATNSAILTVTGFADKDENVSLYLNDEQFGSTLVASDGAFTFPGVQLKEGKNTLFAKAIGPNGKDSANSAVANVLYKKSLPKLELAGPDDNATVTGDKKMVVVSGLTDPENIVTINDHMAVVNPDGSFSYQQSLNDGDNTINITASDAAGNQTKTTRHVKYTSS